MTHRHTMRRILALGVLTTVALAAAGSADSSSLTTFPTGTFLTKLSKQDVVAAGLPASDAHWETLTFRKDGTWTDIWFHPKQANQPPTNARNHYVVTGNKLRLLTTPDTVRWHYANGLMTFTIVSVPDKMARLAYTAHPWQKTN
jgi:hypothetical protein